MNHELLLEKLKLYGFQNIDWFNSYFSNRRQCVKLGSVVSDSKSINCGVPQGSILGPTLFNFYINDIASLNLSSKLLLYADDLVLYLSGNSFPEIFVCMQKDLDLIFQWSVFNKLTISVPKTKAMLCGRKAKLASIKLSSFSVGCDKVC